MNALLSGFAQKLESALGAKMVGLLCLGSTEQHDDTAFSDTDLVLLAKDLDLASLRSVREIVRDLPFVIDMPVIQAIELPANPDLFQICNQGCYFIPVLKSARKICGANFFDDYPNPSMSAVRASVFRKVAEYTWAARRMFVESNRERTLAQNYQLTSRLLKAVKDVLWLEGHSKAYSYTAAQCTAALKASTNQWLPVEDEQTLNLISDPARRNQLAADMSEGFLDARLSVLEKLYTQAVSLLEDRR
jgi:hypothetical protein